MQAQQSPSKRLRLGPLIVKRALVEEEEDDDDLNEGFYHYSVIDDE